jgi:hypothetical protein
MQINVRFGSPGVHVCIVWFTYFAYVRCVYTLGHWFTNTNLDLGLGEGVTLFNTDSFGGKRIKSETISTVKHYIAVYIKNTEVQRKSIVFLSLSIYYSSPAHISCVYVYLLNCFCRVFLRRFIIINDCAHKYYSVNTLYTCTYIESGFRVDFVSTFAFVRPAAATPNPRLYRARSTVPPRYAYFE